MRSVQVTVPYLAYGCFRGGFWLSAAEQETPAGLGCYKFLYAGLAVPACLRVAAFAVQGGSRPAAATSFLVRYGS